MIRRLILRTSWVALVLLATFVSGCSPGRSVLFVVDTSGSMQRDHLIDDVKQSIKKILLGYDEGDRVVVLSFDGETRLVLDKVLESKQDLGSIYDAIDAIQAEGRWTDLVGALDQSLSRASDQLKADHRKATLVLYTDGKHDPGPQAAARENRQFSDLIRAYYKDYRPGESWFIYYVELDVSEPELKSFLATTGSGRVVEQAEFRAKPDFTLEPRSIAWVVGGLGGAALLLAFFFFWLVPWIRNVQLVPVGASESARVSGHGIALDSFRSGAVARFFGVGKAAEVHLQLGGSKIDVTVDSRGHYFVKPVSGQMVRVEGKVVTAREQVRPGQKIQIGTNEFRLERSVRRPKR